MSSLVLAVLLMPSVFLLGLDWSWTGGLQGCLFLADCRNRNIKNCVPQEPTAMQIR